jgi:SHS2 domain-containing protein
MPTGFRELDQITADIGIEAWGATIPEAFTGAAEGLASLLARIPENILTRTEHISVQGESLSFLLVRFLNEIIYLVETQDLIPGKIKKIWISGQNLFAIVRCAEGSAVDPAIRTHIKAATYHGLQINESDQGVRIRVIFDV